jgi:hypothetical protein
MKISSLALLPVALVLAIAGSSPARADGPPSPPPEAYAACASKADGDACTVQIHDQQIQGTCAPDREGKGLFCRPDHMPCPPPAPSSR